MQKQVFKDAMGVAAFNYGYQAVIFLSSIITGRLLTPSEYGFVALITVITGFIAFFNDAGLSYIIIRSNYKGTFFRSMFMLSIIIGLILFSIIVLLAYPISLFQKSSDLIIPTVLVGLIIFIQTLSVVPSALLRKNLKFKEKAKIDFWCHSLSTVVTIVLAYLGASYWSLIFSQLFVALNQFIFYNRYFNFNLLVIRTQNIKAAFKQTKRMLLNISSSRLINYWSNNFGNLSVGRIYGNASLGVYNRSYSLFTMLSNLIAGVFHSVLLPSMKKMKDEGKSLDHEFYNFLDLIMIICLIPVIIFIFFSVETINILWGANWVEVGLLLPYFGVMAMCYMPIIISYNMFMLNEKESILLRLNTYCTFIIVGSFGIGFLGKQLGFDIDLRTLVFITTIIYVVFVLPLYFYPLFFKIMKIDRKAATITWGYRIVLLAGLCIGIYLNYFLVNIVLMTLLSTDLLYKQRTILKRGFEMVSSKFGAKQAPTSN